MITRESLMRVMNYTQETGAFTWVMPPKNHGRLKAAEAGSRTTGYVLIKLDGRKYKAHRLAWLFVHGDWPNGEIDHINGNPFDNRISNLRIATSAQNQANRRRNENKQYPKGVRILPSGRFNARITVSKRLINIGVYETAADASTAYLKAATDYYGEFARAD